MAKKKDTSLLTADEALGLLDIHLEGKKKRCHSFQGMGFGLFGCDIDLTSIKKYFKTAKHICLSGDNMKGMGHGVAFLKEDSDDYLFLATDEKKLNEIFKLRKIK